MSKKLEHHGVKKISLEPNAGSGSNRAFLHKFYTHPLAFSPELVSSLIHEIQIGRRHTVLDPFCGTGTTLVECKARGIRCIGIDANPVCVLASSVKTNWNIDPRSVLRSVKQIVKSSRRRFGRSIGRWRRAKSAGESTSPLAHRLFQTTKEGKYLVASGLIKRGWISPVPALKALIVATEIGKLRKSEVRQFL